MGLVACDSAAGAKIVARYNTIEIIEILKVFEEVHNSKSQPGLLSGINLISYKPTIIKHYRSVGCARNEFLR